MAGEALFIGWGDVARGREKQAVKVLQESIEYYGRLQQEGLIERFDVMFLGPHGGDLNGFVVLQGDRQQLDEVRSSDEFERLLARASVIVDALGAIPGYTGDALAKQVERFQTAADEFGG